MNYIESEMRPEEARLIGIGAGEAAGGELPVSDESFRRRMLFKAQLPDAQALIARADELYAWRAYEVAEQLRIDEILEELRDTNPAGVHPEELEQLAKDDRLAPLAHHLEQAVLHVEAEVITKQMLTPQHGEGKERGPATKILAKVLNSPARAWRDLRKGNPPLDPELTRKREAVNKAYADKFKSYETEHRAAEESILLEAHELFATNPEHVHHGGRIRKKERLLLSIAGEVRGPHYGYDRIFIERKAGDPDSPLRLYLQTGESLNVTITIPQKEVKRTELTGPRRYDYHKLRFDSPSAVTRFLGEVVHVLQPYKIKRRDEL